MFDFIHEPIFRELPLGAKIIGLVYCPVNYIYMKARDWLSKQSVTLRRRR